MHLLITDMAFSDSQLGDYSIRNLPFPRNQQDHISHRVRWSRDRREFISYATILHASIIVWCRTNQWSSRIKTFPRQKDAAIKDRQRRGCLGSPNSYSNYKKHQRQLFSCCLPLLIMNSNQVHRFSVLIIHNNTIVFALFLLLLHTTGSGGAAVALTKEPSSTTHTGLI